LTSTFAATVGQNFTMTLFSEAKGKHVFALAWTLSFLVGMGSWAYVYGILDPYFKAQRKGADVHAYHSDLYPRWLGTRLALKNHANPYDPAVTREIQRGIYGHPLDATSMFAESREFSEDPHAFAYPASVIVLLAPFAMLPFATISPVFSLLGYAMAFLLMPLFMLGLGQKWNRGAVWTATFLLFASFPLVLALYVQQLTVVVIFAMAAGVACLVHRRFVLAGILFAVATIKPQLSALISAWLVMWSITQWRARRRVLVSFLASTAFLLLSPELVVSRWFPKWLGAANRFLHYPQLRIPAMWLLPRGLAQLMTAALLVPVVILLWRLRTADPGEERFGFAIALALSATLLAVPIWPALQYHHLLLIPAALVMVHLWTRVSKRQKLLSFLALAALAFSSIGALVVSAAVLMFRVPIGRLGHLVEMPLFNFSIVSLTTTAALIGLLWPAAAAG
jgi:Glycosyltransferase family 87